MKYEIKMDFYQDWISHLRKVLEKAGYSPATNQEEVSMQYFNLLRRLIPAVPRKVRMAKEFTCPPELRSGLCLVTEKIEQGKDLRSHLSRNIIDLDYDDDLLNDWDIYHLHLGTSIDDDGFVKRTGPVLFVRFDGEFAYFINVMGHGSWTNQDMIRIIHRNWPESIERFRIKGVLGLNNSLTNQDIKKLRKAHVVSFIEPEPGVVYGPPGMGLTTSGIGLGVVRASDHYAKLIRGYEDIIKGNIEDISDKVKDEGIVLGKKLSFILKIEEESVLAYEENHNVIVNLGKLQ
ncbi:hypothetical protein SAFG77S_11611 [Streptomyces afghaniensis]